MYARITTYTHGFIVESTRPQVQRALVDYSKRLAEFKFEKPNYWTPARRVMDRIYAAATFNRSEYRFHINCLDDLVSTFYYFGVAVDQIEWVRKDPPQPAPNNLRLAIDFKPRPGQDEIIEFLSNPEQKNKVVQVQTGGGKTITSLVAMLNLNWRTIIQLKGGFIHRWTDELEANFSFKKEDVIVIRGRDSLQSLINQARQGELQASIIIITWKTLFNLFKSYEQDPVNNIYGISPEQLYELCNIGLRINDEVHMDYHLNFRSDLYCNCLSTIQLSATLDTDDPFRKKIYEISLPSKDWFKGLDPDKYIGVYSLRYRINNPKLIKTTERGDPAYSHQRFEKSILRSAKMRKNYVELVNQALERFFINDYKEGKRAIIYCSLIDMCETIALRLKRYYPELDINVYKGSTPVEVLSTADILVTTIESCGVAVDIENLTFSLLTRALAKKEMNEQVMGRLRRPKDFPDVTPVFTFLTCQDIQKHLDYEEKKYNDLKSTYLYFRTDTLRVKV